MWFTGPNNDIPVDTGGYVTQAPGDKGPKTPCVEFLSQVVKDLPVSSIDKNYSRSPVSVASASLTASPTSNATYTYNRKFTSSSYRGLLPPIFHGDDVTGCFAMTGLEKTTFITTEVQEYTGTGFVTAAMPMLTITSTMACSKYTDNAVGNMPGIVSFARSPVCTSYLNWAKDHPEVPHSVYPPGVFNFDVYTEWGCSGRCWLNANDMRVLYFASKSYDGCSAISSTAPVDPSITKYAVLDGSTL